VVFSRFHRLCNWHERALWSAAALERLISTGALTRAEVSDILREARNDLEPYKSISSVADAVGVVGKLAARLRQIPAPPA
jgi:hypothetical protein